MRRHVSIAIDRSAIANGNTTQWIEQAVDATTPAWSLDPQQWPCGSSREIAANVKSNA
jgi:hypothetical protein